MLVVLAAGKVLVAEKASVVVRAPAESALVEAPAAMIIAAMHASPASLAGKIFHVVSCSLRLPDRLQSSSVVSLGRH